MRKDSFSCINYTTINTMHVLEMHLRENRLVLYTAYLPCFYWDGTRFGLLLCVCFL